jgi:glycosyltransferase involved in cell wall biosynthesis
VRISIAVHGRFHAFDLAAALLRYGADVRLLASARRKTVARKFPLDRTRTFDRHLLLSHAARKIAGGEPPAMIEKRLKQMFGRWAAKQHIAQRPDIVHCWSGIAEETLRACRDRSFCSMARGSAHIRVQHALLSDEQRRTGRTLEMPSSWIIEREEREYELAHAIVVPSSFARDTFLERGVSAGKLRLVPLATRATGFIAPVADITARVRRLRSGGRLRVLYIGMLSYRKGMHDMLDVVRTLSPSMDFRFVGPLLAECSSFAAEATAAARVDGAVPESDLPDVYAWGDVFVLPTIEDGFAVVLAQAQAAGLPIITTTNSGGPDIIHDGGKGFIVPIRDAQSIIDRLIWCNDHRDEVAQMVEALHERPPARSWDDVAQDFVRAMTA